MGTDELDFVSNNAIAQSRRTYLLTYSCADMERFTDWTAFTKCVLDAFESGKSSARVVQYALCKENHSDGVSKHYHMAAKQRATQLWLVVLKVLSSKHNIVVNFPSEPCECVVAYRHVCKGKPVEEVLNNEGHINLETMDSPRTENAIRRRSANASKQKT